MESTTCTRCPGCSVASLVPSLLQQRQNLSTANKGEWHILKKLTWPVYWLTIKEVTLSGMTAHTPRNHYSSSSNYSDSPHSVLSTCMSALKLCCLFSFQVDQHIWFYRQICRQVCGDAGRLPGSRHMCGDCIWTCGRSHCWWVNNVMCYIIWDKNGGTVKFSCSASSSWIKYKRKCSEWNPRQNEARCETRSIRK